MANVPAGSYVVSGKTTVVQTEVVGGGLLNASTRCTLVAGANTDYAETELGRASPDESGRATLHTNVTTTFTGTGTITLTCRRGNNSGTPKASVARQTKIIAVKVDTATRTAVTG